MIKTFVRSSKHELFRDFRELYKSSFPIFEQRSLRQQDLAFDSPHYHLIAYQQEEQFIGFISYWDLEAYIYIEHLAVQQAMRGRGYGRRMLSDFMTSESKRLMLEIDPITDEVSRSRLRFYESLGFTLNHLKHTHPPYRLGYNAHELLILSTQGLFDVKLYEDFCNKLNENIMNFEPDPID